MTKYSDNLVLLIKEFDVSQEAAEVYTELLKNGSMGIVAISRLCKLGRNVAYRLLNELEEAQLVSVAQKSFGKEYSARNLEAFESKLATKEAEVHHLRSSLESLADGLQALASSGKSRSKITHFPGKGGLRQVNWNLTKAKSEFRVYEQSHVHEYIDKDFADLLRDKYIENRITTFDITNKTRVEGYMDRFFTDYWKDHSHYRYIDPGILDIQFEIYIYNDVLTLLDYTSRIPHCIEINNPILAAMQKQIYDLVWQQGLPMDYDVDTGVRTLSNVPDGAIAHST